LHMKWIFDTYISCVVTRQSLVHRITLQTWLWSKISFSFCLPRQGRRWLLI
jgi:hypothetical protein